MILAGNSISNNYTNARAERSMDHWKKIQPQLDGKYGNQFQTFLFDNPIFENYITNYMEQT